ncbi:MAG: hypothetical protein ACYDHP_05790 [Ferrimicrobium sp.]
MLKWVRKNPVLTGAGSVALAGLVVSAITSGGFSSTLAATSCGYGYGYACTTTVPPAPAAGYHLAAKDGGVFNFGNAGYYGNTYTLGLTGLMGSHPLNSPIVGMAENPIGGGYWLVAADGGVFNFGNAGYYGNTYTLGLTGLAGSHPLNSPIVGMVPTPNGMGYWLVAADGGVFNFGNAKYFGSTYTLGLTGLAGSHPLNAPIVGMGATPDGMGYWLVAKDGGIFNFGDAAYKGNTYTLGLTGLNGSHRLNAPIVGMAPTPTGGGYWLVAADGGVFNFGNAAYDGSTYTLGLTGLTGSHSLNAAIVGMVPTPSGGGYWLAAADGGVFNFGNAAYSGSTYTLGLTGLTGSHPLNQPVVGIGG